MLMELSADGELHVEEASKMIRSERPPLSQRPKAPLVIDELMQHRRHSQEVQNKQNKQTRRLAILDNDLKLGIAKCRGGGQTQRWPELKKFDLLISWWTDSPQSEVKASSLLQQQESSRFENQAEIKYALRSFEKYGLLDHVANVYILVDEAVLKQYGAPRSFNYSNKALHIVTDRDMGVVNKTGEQTKWRKFLALDKIPNLSDYFLWLPDDNFMMRPFEMQYLYDSAEGKPKMYTHGNYRLGWCDDMPPVGSAHGPVLLNKCAYTAIADKMWRTMTTAEHNKKAPIDVLCLYTNAMRQEWQWRNQDRQFHRECHTNAVAGCFPFGKSETPLFLNVQGNGVSDEYDSQVKPNWGLAKVMPHGPAGFFHENFPKPSRFEI